MAVGVSVSAATAAHDEHCHRLWVRAKGTHHHVCTCGLRIGLSRPHAHTHCGKAQRVPTAMGRTTAVMA